MGPSKSKAPEGLSKSKAPEGLSKSKAPEGLSESKAPEGPSKSKAPEGLSKAPEGHSKSKTPEGSSKSKAGALRYQKVAPSLYTDVRYMPPWRPSAAEIPENPRRSQEARQHASQQICDKATKKQSLQEEVGGMA